MIRMLTPRSNNMMNGVLQANRSPNTDSHSSLQLRQGSDRFGCHGVAGNLLSTQVAAGRLASSSRDSGLDASDLLPSRLNNLESGGCLMSSDVSAAGCNATANFLLPKPSIWGTGDSEYSWVQDGLSRSSGSMDESSLLSNDMLGTDTSRVLELTAKECDTLGRSWTLHGSYSSSATTSIHSMASPQARYQRRSWQPESSDGGHGSLGQLLLPSKSNGHGHNNNLLAALSSSSSALNDSKSNLESHLGNQRSLGSLEATSVYDSVARKIQNEMSGLDDRVNSGASTADLSAMGFSDFLVGQVPTRNVEASDNRMSSGMFSQTGFIQQHQKNEYTVSSVDHNKTYLTNSQAFFNHNFASSPLDTKTIMSSTMASSQKISHHLDSVNSTKLLLDSLSGNSALNVFPVTRPALGQQSYLFSTQEKVDRLESLRKWPSSTATVTTTTAGADLACLDSLHGRLPFTGTFGDNKEDGQNLYDATSWAPGPAAPPRAGHQEQANEIMSTVPENDSRKRFLNMGLGQTRINIPHKRLHTETESGQAAALPASLKCSSSWASSLTSNCSKGQEPVIPGSGGLPCMKSSSRLAAGPALNTNLKPRARQGSANDPQSIAARHRRERISERLKVLQDLVPNGSKVDLVTMLEKAINYVKFLQVQVKVLTTDDYWPSNKKGAAPCTALPNFEDMEGALKVLVAQAQKEAGAHSEATAPTTNSSSDATRNVETSPDAEEIESASPRSSDSD